MLTLDDLAEDAIVGHRGTQTDAANPSDVMVEVWSFDAGVQEPRGKQKRGNRMGKSCRAKPHVERDQFDGLQQAIDEVVMLADGT